MVSNSGRIRPKALASSVAEAFYQPKNFGEDAYRIRFFGQVKDIHSAQQA